MQMNGGRRTFHYLALLLSAVCIGVLAIAAGTPPAQAAGSSGWNIVPSANTSAQDSNILLGTACTSSWNCWAVGGVIPNLNNNGQPSALIDHWNGSTWSVDAATPLPGSQVSLLWDVTCATSSDCWAVGAEQVGADPGPVTLAEHWNGVTWSSVPTPATHGFLSSVTCIGGSDCWAVGTTLTDDGNSSPLNGFIDHWNGSSWSQVTAQPSGQVFDQFNSVTCAAPTDCWAVGFAGPNALQNGFLPNVAPNVAGANALIEHWNGVAWTIVPSPSAVSPLGTYLAAVTCAGNAECWAVGATMDANGNPSTALVDHWDATQWSTMPSANPAAPADLLTDVTCFDGANCWAVGASGIQSGQNQNFQPSPFVENWNGTAWSIQPSPNVTAFAYLDSVACVGGSGCFATGFAGTNLNNNFTLQTLVEQMQLPAGTNQGLWMSASDGGIFTFGDAAFHGSMGGVHLNAPVVGMAATPDGGGYWEVASDGGIFTFGDAAFHGSMGGVHLNAPVVGMAATPDGGGYWEVASDGGIFTFGDAAFHGSMGGVHLNAPVVGMAATPDGGGYWEVASDGGIFTFGDAAFHGSMGGVHLNAPVVGMAATPDGGGYWEVASDGGIFTFGDAAFYGSVPGQGIVQHIPVVGIVGTASGHGYWIAGRDGALYSYGDASFLGSLSGIALNAPVTGEAAGP